MSNVDDLANEEEGGDTADEDAGNENSEENESGDESETTVKGKTKAVSKPHIQRYKGLGEMNADELGETTMDINNRILKQVTIEDAVEADRIIDVLMGNDVPARKTFIQTNAKTANIDF